MVKVAACLPAYNEERTIANIVKVLKKYVDVVIVCDDGSSDMTGRLAEDSGAYTLRNEDNRGKGVALDMMFKVAKRMNADVIVTLDADGQHDPRDVPYLVSPILEGECEMVIGSRFLRDASIPQHKKVGNYLLNLFTNIFTNSRFTDTQSGFRAYGKKALDSIEIKEKDIGVDSQIVIDAVRKKLSIKEIPIEVCYSGLDTSTYNPISHSMKVITSVLKYKFVGR
ncbi:MAG: glycosyltransferase family 2 protein [Candidatus Methylarchaceae archaeon HK01B]|nr:glycosyltransferase family 2 protein [Candidatus Methylarchaceae archaeon HK01M]MCP8318935.1 glycosyltransferase family 2 protein [Candidatus Methylarchaceae archaeon HK01B]